MFNGVQLDGLDFEAVDEAVDWLVESLLWVSFILSSWGGGKYCEQLLLFDESESKTPPQEIFFTHLTVQSVGPNHLRPLVIENWFLF